jgi:pimeloyl-ACP methyl ester carboxylesterase
MTEWMHLDSGGTRIALAKFGGQGPAVLLLHGLVGHAEEWQETASWLAHTHAVFGIDLRGHGRSERTPEDVSISAHVSDVVAAANHIGSPVVLVGHSVSGIIGVAAAAARPHLVSALAVSEASVAGLDDESAVTAAEELATSLRRWPEPFKSRDEAICFF